MSTGAVFLWVLRVFLASHNTLTARSVSAIRRSEQLLKDENDILSSKVAELEASLAALGEQYAAECAQRQVLVRRTGMRAERLNTRAVHAIIFL